MAAEVGIRAISYTLPDRLVSLTALAASGQIDTPVEVLADFGFERVAVSNRPADELALVAVRGLVESARIDPETVDALFYAGAIPDSHRVGDGTPLESFNYPVARLQYECGFINAVTIGIGQGGCTGLMSAVALACDYLHAHLEKHRVVCVSADVLPPSWKREIIYNVVSDGACAVIVERDSPRNRIVAYRQIVKGYYWSASARKNEIVAAYFPTARTIVHEVLAQASLAVTDIALVVPHNVSLRSWRILLPLLGIGEDRLFADNIAAKGHVIAADNFINLKDAWDAGRIGRGDRLLLFNFGFGAHWSCLLLEA